MLDLPNLPASVEVLLRLALIALAGLIAFFVLRAAVGVGMRHLLERRSQEAGGGVLAPAEMERRVQTIGRLVVRVAGSVIAIIAVLMALRLFGIDIGPAVAGLGVLGIAVGFGAQTLVRDWLAGIFIVLENQYSQGDVIRIAGVEGVVEDFSLRRTTLRGADGAIHTVPNGQIMVTSNITRVRAAVTLELYVDGKKDADRAGEIVERVGAELQAEPAWHARLLEPPSVVEVAAGSDASVKVTVRAKARAAEQVAVGDELRTRILAALAEAGIKVPYPGRAVVSHTDEPGDGA
ncbi:MAG: moderate conductance mechanosensitive channel [Chloroflexota bacterium]|jgi:small conductance mechanosensitive channel|nr:moderate conductance mechanosensitive channel [Chloroflexota bacterium]